MTNKTVEEVFLKERTCSNYDKTPVELELLQEIYDTMKFGPTSANSCPLRIIFVQSARGKEMLASCAMQGNVEKINSAPVTAIFAYDLKFYEKLSTLFPHNKDIQKYFSSNDDVINDTAQRNSTLQAAYFMMIARNKGLGCGPMSGFDPNAVNKHFLNDTNYKVNFICTLGYRAKEESYDRLPRLDFDEVCTIV